MTVEQWQMDPTAKGLQKDSTAKGLQKDPTAKGLQKDSTAKELQKDPTEEGRQKGVKFFFRIIFCNCFAVGMFRSTVRCYFAGTVQTELYIQWAYFHN